MRSKSSLSKIILFYTVEWNRIFYVAQYLLEVCLREIFFKSSEIESEFFEIAQDDEMNKFV